MNLAELDAAGCLVSLANGANGQVLQMVNGVPTWTTLVVNCEDIQDCVGGGMAIASGLNYNDAAGTFETAQNPAGGLRHTASGDALDLNSLGFEGSNPTIVGVPVSTAGNPQGTLATPDELANVILPRVTTGAGAPAATADDPTIYTDTTTGITYYRDTTGAIVAIEQPPHTSVAASSASTGFTILQPPPISNQTGLHPISVSITNPSAFRSMVVSIDFSGYTFYGNLLGPTRIDYTFLQGLSIDAAAPADFSLGGHATSLLHVKPSAEQIAQEIGPTGYHAVRTLAPGATITVTANADLNYNGHTGVFVATDAIIVKQGHISLHGTTV